MLSSTGDPDLDRRIEEAFRRATKPLLDALERTNEQCEQLKAFLPFYEDSEVDRRGGEENLLECPNCLQGALREQCTGMEDWHYRCKSCGWHVWTSKKQNFSEAPKGE